MDKAMERAKVLDYDLQRQVKPHMALLSRPLPSIYYPDFIAANHEARADSVVPGTDKQAHLEHTFGLTFAVFRPRTSLIVPSYSGLRTRNATNSHSEVSPSTIFAVAAILEGKSFVNGAPQNTFASGVIALAEREKSFIGADDQFSTRRSLLSCFLESNTAGGPAPLVKRGTDVANSLCRPRNVL
ncbi:hypothetical protein DEU56DRAFT_947106 [Suillus clintonianus]|uniref:uncharacterized protein n=1 Tax=Suillus clintonianus TaxID=1904413 RepID=UPI001B86583E|nr:uncharacterized protein DEU56DRAFT_947106 [Suillus clintonianus]KAG2136419.1 hypothetical protein DEU56DRAFT_947106 [Suillus clintonianus]